MDEGAVAAYAQDLAKGGFGVVELASLEIRDALCETRGERGRQILRARHRRQRREQRARSRDAEEATH